VEIFALGAAIGKFTACKKSKATWLLGILIQIYSLQAVTILGIFSFFLRRIVIGPGMSLSIISCSIGEEIVAYWVIWSLVQTWTIIGFFCGLPLIKKIFFTARWSRAFAQSP
jgi:hypothetical protein